MRLPLHRNLERDEAKLPVWYCCRGTNRVESFHTLVRLAPCVAEATVTCSCMSTAVFAARTHASHTTPPTNNTTPLPHALQAHDLLSGGNNSPAYFVRRLTYMIGVWNIRTDIKHGRLPDYKTYNMPLLRQINANCRKLGKPEPYIVPLILPASERIKHGFHFDWKNDDIIAGVRNRHTTGPCMRSIALRAQPTVCQLCAAMGVASAPRDLFATGCYTVTVHHGFS